MRYSVWEKAEMGPKRRRLFRGRIFSVFQGKKTLPNGRVAYFEEVEHPGAAIVIPFYGEKIIFIRQYRGVIGKYIWELPAGTLAPGESPASCAKRELTEETGFMAKDLRRLGYIYTTPGFCNEKIVVFRALCRPGGRIERDTDEVIRTRAFKRKEVRRLFSSGRICDSKTIAALCFAGVL